MRQIVVISGKGGTGKTVVAASMAFLARNKVMVDCDVDAADLHLLLHPVIRERYEFSAGKTAFIDEKICVKCGKCRSLCRFQAIKPDFSVEDFSCEGCGLCSQVCPRGAVRMKDNISGEWFISDTAGGPFVHARLGIAEENSGKLVARIREAARDIALARGSDYVIIDGPPGIGCPVIASLSGADCALIVTEPTLSGLHDAGRVMEVAFKCGVDVRMAVNKYDLNPDMASKIEEFCREKRVPVAGRIPFDKSVVQAVVEGKSIVEGFDSPVSGELKNVWERIKS